MLRTLCLSEILEPFQGFGVLEVAARDATSMWARAVQWGRGRHVYLLIIPQLTALGFFSANSFAFNFDEVGRRECLIDRMLWARRPDLWISPLCSRLPGYSHSYCEKPWHLVDHEGQRIFENGRVQKWGNISDSECHDKSQVLGRTGGMGNLAE